MKKTVILLLFLALAGCKPLKYEEVKTLEKWCTDHAMRPEYQMFNATRGNPSGTNEVIGIRCINERGQSFNPQRQGPQ